MLDESCLLRGNIQMRTHASQVCSTFDEVRDAIGVPCVQDHEFLLL